MQRLHVCLQRLRREQRPAVAAAFEKGHPRRHRIPGERVEGENQRPLDQPMDHKPMLIRIDVRSAAPGHDEMQPVRGDRAVHQMVRCAGALSPWLPLRVVQRPHDVLLERRWPFVGPDGSAGLEAPRRIGQWRIRRRLGGGAGQRPEWCGAYRAGKDDPAPEQRATIQ